MVTLDTEGQLLKGVCLSAAILLLDFKLVMSTLNTESPQMKGDCLSAVILSLDFKLLSWQP